MAARKPKEDLSNFSLQLLTMPDFMRSLKIGGGAGGEGRTSFVGKDERYGVKTLVGNWWERRATDLPGSAPVNSTYRTDFEPLDHELARQSKISTFNVCDDHWSVNQGLPYLELIREGPADQYQKNSSSLYDLTYGRVCPDLYRTRKAAVVKKITRHKPENDYALEYGNLSDHGYRRYKMDEWSKEEEAMARLRSSTMYRDDFTELPLQDKPKIKSAFKVCSSSFNKILLDNQNFKPRGLALQFVSEDCDLEPRPRTKTNIVPLLD